MKLQRRFTIRLDADRYDELERYSDREGFSVSIIIRHLVYRFLEDQRRLSVAKLKGGKHEQLGA